MKRSIFTNVEDPKENKINKYEEEDEEEDLSSSIEREIRKEEEGDWYDNDDSSSLGSVEVTDIPETPVLLRILERYRKEQQTNK